MCATSIVFERIKIFEFSTWVNNEIPEADIDFDIVIAIDKEFLAEPVFAQPIIEIQEEPDLIRLQLEQVNVTLLMQTLSDLFFQYRSSKSSKNRP